MMQNILKTYPELISVSPAAEAGGIFQRILKLTLQEQQIVLGNFPLRELFPTFYKQYFSSLGSMLTFLSYNADVDDKLIKKQKDKFLTTFYVEKPGQDLESVLRSVNDIRIRVSVVYNHNPKQDIVPTCRVCLVCITLDFSRTRTFYERSSKCEKTLTLCSTNTKTDLNQCQMVLDVSRSDIVLSR